MENSVALLQSLGLSGAEARAYLALLRLGSATGGGLAAAAGLYSANAYDALGRLCRKGLASHSVLNGKKFFQAVGPECLATLVEAERLLLREREVRLARAVAELSVQGLPSRGGRVRVFTGVEGVKRILDEVVREKRDWLVLGLTGRTRKVFGKWVEVFQKRRVAARVQARILANADAEAAARAREFARLKLTSVRYLPAGYSSPSTVYVYGARTAVIVWSEDEPLGCVFDDERVTAGFRAFFELLWNNASTRPSP